MRSRTQEKLQKVKDATLCTAKCDEKIVLLHCPDALHQKFNYESERVVAPASSGQDLPKINAEKRK